MQPVSSSSFEPGGWATGIGSLPGRDPQAALALVAEHLPDIPHWPQLPGRGPREHFVHQFLQPLEDCGLLRVEGDRRCFDAAPETLADRLTEFYQQCLPAETGDPVSLDRFMPPPDAAPGFHAFLKSIDTGELKNSGYLKGQIVGPLTVGLTLHDHQGRPAYYHGDLRDVILRTLALNACCQTISLGQTGCIPIIFVDDPAVGAWGTRGHLALDREAIRRDFEMLFTAIRSRGGLAGFHACQAVDWSLVLAARPDILSLDAYRFGDSLLPFRKDLDRFLDEGGVMAWGIVPTLDDPFAMTADTLRKRLEDLWKAIFPENPGREKLLRRSLITPACGTGLLTPEQARRIYRLTAELSGQRQEALARYPEGSQQSA